MNGARWGMDDMLNAVLVLLKKSANARREGRNDVSQIGSTTTTTAAPLVHEIREEKSWIIDSRFKLCASCELLFIQQYTRQFVAIWNESYTKR